MQTSCGGRTLDLTRHTNALRLQSCFQVRSESLHCANLLIWLISLTQFSLTTALFDNSVATKFGEIQNGEKGQND